jgi:hypothetical protein
VIKPSVVIKGIAPAQLLINIPALTDTKYNFHIEG